MCSRNETMYVITAILIGVFENLIGWTGNHTLNQFDSGA